MTSLHTLSSQQAVTASHFTCLCPSLLKDSKSETYLLGPREMMGTVPPTHRRGYEVTLAMISSSIQTLTFQWLPSNPLACPRSQSGLHGWHPAFPQLREVINGPQVWCSDRMPFLKWVPALFQRWDRERVAEGEGRGAGPGPLTFEQGADVPDIDAAGLHELAQ